MVTCFEQFEGKTWDQILDSGSHRIPWGKLCDAARSRFIELGYEDLDEVMSFRLTGTWRVWCLCDGLIMRVLWWDPNHQVCPTPVDKADRRKLRNRK